MCLKSAPYALSGSDNSEPTAEEESSLLAFWSPKLWIETQIEQFIPIKHRKSSLNSVYGSEGYTFRTNYKATLYTLLTLTVLMTFESSETGEGGGLWSTY